LNVEVLAARQDRRLLSKNDRSPNEIDRELPTLERCCSASGAMPTSAGRAKGLLDRPTSAIASTISATDGLTSATEGRTSLAEGMMPVLEIITLVVESTTSLIKITPSLTEVMPSRFEIKPSVTEVMTSTSEVRPKLREMTTSTPIDDYAIDANKSTINAFHATFDPFRRHIHHSIRRHRFHRSR
jgi:hypothetical protein